MPKTTSKKPITADKLGLAESMVGGAKKRRGRPKKFQTLAEVEADINLREFQKSQEKLKKEKEKNKALKFLTKRVDNNETKITKLKNILKLRRENEKKNKDNVDIKPDDIKPDEDNKDVDIKPDEDKKDEVMDFLTNILQPSLTKIEENLSKILGNFDEQIETEKEKQDDLRVAEDTASDKAREANLEKPKEKGMLGTGINKAIKPVTGMMDMIMNFFKNILLGSAFLGLLKIIQDPEIIMKPLRDFTNGIIDFINGVIRGINKFVLGPINFVIQGFLDGLQFILSPFDAIAKKFGADFDLSLDEFRENIQPMQIPEIPNLQGPVEMQGGGEVPERQENMVEGGEVPGQGTGDTVPAMLEPGEFVMSKGAVENEGLENLEQMNAEGGGTNQPIIKDGTTYAQGGGSIDVKGKGNTGKMTMKNSDGKPVGRYNVVSGQPGFEHIPQEMRNDVPGKGYPMPDGTYKVHSFEEHGPLSGALRGLGDWSAYIGSGDGNMGNRTGMMIHSDIDPYGTLGCLGVNLGGKPGTRAEKGFLKAWNASNPETITVDFGAPTGGMDGNSMRSETSDNSIAKMSSSQPGSTITPPPPPNGGNGGLVAMSGKSGNTGGLTSGNAPAAKSGAKRFSSSDVRDDSNIVVQSIYNLVG